MQLRNCDKMKNLMQLCHCVTVSQCHRQMSTTSLFSQNLTSLEDFFIFFLKIFLGFINILYLCTKELSYGTVGISEDVYLGCDFTRCE